MNPEIVKVEKVSLPGEKVYTGQGYYSGTTFIPHGFGWLSIRDSRVYGYFVEGVLNGPAYHPMDYMMYTMHMKNDRGNGWGIMINSGVLVFGKYENSDLKVEMTDAVQWYYDLMIRMGKRESMFHGFYNAGEIMIGWKGNGLDDYMGFHFLLDGTLFVGSSKSLKKTGYFMKFCNDGMIQIGEFIDGVLATEMDIQSLINHYYDDDLLQLQSTLNGGDFDPNNKVLYQDIRIDTSINYFNLSEKPSLKKEIQMSHESFARIEEMENDSPEYIDCVDAIALPLDSDEITIKRIKLQDGEMTFWGMVDEDDSPLGYGLIEIESSNAMSLVFHDYDEIHNFEDECQFLFDNCHRVQSACFYGSNAYIGDITSKASWYESSHYSTSRYGVAILKEGMYVGEFPAGFKMKKVIGRFYDLNGDVWSGVFNLPIEQDPDWIDKDGGIFPF